MTDFIKYWPSDCDDKELEITKIYVNPQNRNKGNGRKLVESAISYAKENGFKTVSLYAYAQEEGGLTTEQLINWYSSMGFESDGDDSSLMTYTL